MKFNSTYFSCLRQAIERGSLPQLQEALSAIRKDHWRRTLKRHTKASDMDYNTVARMTTCGLVDVRGEDDITPLILTCLLYHEKMLKGDRRGAAALNDIAGWLLAEGACVNAEGCRPPVRTVDRNTGKTVYVRGRGKNLLEALGWSALPPSVQRHMQPGRFQPEARRQDSRLAVAA